MNEEILAESFETNCAEYDIGSEHGTIRKQGDCFVLLYG